MRNVMRATVAMVVLAGVLAGALVLRAEKPAHPPESGEASAAKAARAAASKQPFFAGTEPAANPVRLCLLPDGRKVLGWISGKKTHTGREVTVQHGAVTQTILVQRDNTFTWYHRVEQPADVAFSVGALKESVRVEPQAAEKPSAFFVVDRTVYRPGQPLHFAAFLRACADGRFSPIPDKRVEVKIVSVKKKTTAAKLKLTTDDFGRILGSYAFTQADALDDYALSIDGYTGAATVKLAEFRKSKIKLEIAGEVESGRLALTLRALDFLGKPAAGSKVRLNIQVVRRSGEPRKKGDLKASDFVYGPSTPAWLPNIDTLTEDQALLCEAGVGYVPLYGQSGRRVVEAVMNRDVDLAGEGRGVHTVDLKPGWRGGEHAVLVEGVLTDQNGREQRATKLIPLTGTKAGGIELALRKRHYGVDEPVRVAAAITDKTGKPVTAPMTVVAMRLEPRANPYAYYPAYSNQIWRGNPLQGNFAYPWHWRGRRGLSRRSWRPMPRFRAAERNMVTAAIVRDGEVTLKPHLPDGAELRREIGCVVRGAENLPALALELDADAYAAGGTLRGTLHSRFAGARVLLTLRDSRGIRLWKSVDVEGAATRIAQRLPEGLAHGCNVEVQYAGREGRLHTADALIRVKPVDRLLAIETTTEDVHEPGAEVKVDIRVNRREPVDLVVSVYDQSLLGIAPDRSVDIRSFYLADERVTAVAARERLRRILGSATVEGMAEEAKALLKTCKPDDPRRQVLQQIVNCVPNRYVHAHHMAQMLRFAGVPVHGQHHYGSWYARLDKNVKAHRLWELLHRKRSQWSLQYAFCHDTLVLAETHPNVHRRYGHWGPFQQLHLRRGGRAYGARGDSHFSVSGNGMFSVSGQSFISHLPGPSAAPVSLIDLEGGGSAVVRRDFSDSAFWAGNVRTDAGGRATVRFKLPDSLTNWIVVVTAVSKDMHVGRHWSSFRTFRPVMVWPMVPRVFSVGDRVRLYASVHNRTEKGREIRVQLKAKNGRVLSSPEQTVFVPARDNRPVYWTYEPIAQGFTQLLMSAECEAGSDASLKRLPVVAAAVEKQVAQSGFCTGGSSFEVPQDADLSRR
jgi:hypothetical protein